jgi:hypothetical protein
MHRATSTCLRAVWLVVLGGCSLVDPRVGPLQASCTAGEQGDYGSGGTSSGYGDDGGATCGPDSGRACDDCESLHCCETRLACFGDRVCGCADQALDGCLGMAGGNDDGGAPDASARCWAAFAASGTIAQARVSCQRTWCQQACSIP